MGSTSSSGGSISGKPSKEWEERWPEFRRLKVDEGRTIPQIAKKLGITVAQAENYWQRNRHRLANTVEPTITAPAPPKIHTAVLWAKAEEATDHDLERHSLERFVDVGIADTLPIGLSFISDQHIRSSGPVQVRRMREDAQHIRDTPGLYAVLGGDGVDNHIKHREAMVGGGTKISDDWRLYDHYLGMFGSKLLAMISGNHDDWTRDFAATDNVAMLAQKNRIHYSPDELLMRLDLKGVPYRIGIRHQYRFGSSFNLTHTVKRWWEMGNDPWDIGVICHQHQPAVEPFIKHGRRIWAARPGSYQTTSTFSRRHGFNLTSPTCPTFILFPTDHRVMGFWDVREASSYLSFLRAGWPECWVA